MNAFYIEGGRLSPEDARHAAKVLRLRPGDEIVALDGIGGRFRARLKEDGSVEQLELLAQKLTELGVTRLVPVEMERSVRHFEMVERLRKIAREAAKQCRRALPMEITEPMPWQKAVLDMRKRELLVAPWEEAVDGRLTDLPPCTDVGLLIGPEGGISAREIAESGARTVTLGARILRTETAALAATAIVMAIMGEI